MFIGLVGKPNAGKSTLFNALTHGHAQVAAYPFTTINPNQGVGFATVDCACKALGVKCSPRVGSCVDGVRRVPVNFVDVAGLVPGASEGKGRGNQFLNDLVAADALIVVVDASGSTDEEGNPAQGFDVTRDVSFIEEELFKWVRGILHKNVQKAKGKKFSELVQYLTGIKVNEQAFRSSVSRLGIDENLDHWTRDQLDKIAAELIRTTKPSAVAANKMDLPASLENLAKLREKFPQKTIVGVAADFELALNYAAGKGLVSYDGKDKITKAANLDERASKALDRIISFVSQNGGTGVPKLVNEVVFNLLGHIVVYPVEDESHYADHLGRVLPDAVLLPAGSTAHDLAGKIHTDLQKGFLHAVNAKTKMRMGADAKLHNGDIVKIVSSR